MEELIREYQLQPLNVKKLEGYDSINYGIETASGTYVLKHYRDAQELDVISAEDKMLEGLSGQLPFRVPTPVKPIKILKEGTFIRLLSFIEGDLLSRVAQTDMLLFDFGKSIGWLNQALLGKKSHAIAARKQCWDMQHCLLNRPKMKAITSPSKRKLAAYFFDLFEHHILPLQHNLRHSIIHSDLNDKNVLIHKNTIAGFIDFGDISYAPLLYEIAIALTYIMLANPTDPFHKAGMVLKGYHSVLPLQKEEVALLYYLIPARLSVSVCNSADARAKNNDTAYILIDEKPAWHLLQQWIQLSPIWVRNQFLSVLEMAPVVMEAATMLQKRKEYTGKSLSLSYDDPIYMTSAAFQYMYDHEGNTYLDARNNIPHVGHCHPEISRVIATKTRKLNTNTRYIYDEFVEYAEKLLCHFPPNLNKIFFVNSGSAATDLAIRMAKTYNRRDHLAVLEHGYHGNTMAAIHASAYKFDGKGGRGIPEHILKLPLPKLYRGLYSNTEDYVNNAVTQLEQAIADKKTPAAFLAEPISGAGGQVPLAPGYVKALQPFLDGYDMLTIIDEVQTGFGRLGSHFWGFEMHEFIPDIVILGKPMGNGHPVAAVVTTEGIADAFANGMEFFSSFGGNPVSCAVAAKVLDIMEEEQLMQNAYTVGNTFISELKKLQSEFSCIGDVRGSGLFLGVEFIHSSGKPYSELANHIKNELKANLVLVGTDGPYDSVLKIKPPLCFTKQNVDRIIALLYQILKNRA
ncbi:MAG: aminotransferase class III-fold pyridoxal phosphate-dependent enzyme [Bacteroidota bacterium]